MAVTGVTAAAATATTAGAAAQQTSVDFSMFLKLLTTQMQNQDPLKPMDSTEYTQQLAQFTQVEQTVKQTSALNDILAQLSTQNMAQASSFIGREAEFDSAAAGLSATTPARWRIAAPAGATTMTATIADAAGKTVATRTLAADASELAWDGTLANGTKAAAGTYTLSLAATDSSGGKLAAGITSIGTVGDVQVAHGVVTLGVGGARLPLSQLIKVSAAES